jgi:hypothetical protein
MGLAAPSPAPPSQTVREVLPHTAFPQAVDRQHSVTPRTLTDDPSDPSGSRVTPVDDGDGRVAESAVPRPVPSLHAHLARGSSLEWGCVVPTVITTTASSDFRSAFRHFAGSLLIGVISTGHRRAAPRRHSRFRAETDLPCSTSDCVIVPPPTTPAGSSALHLQDLHAFRGLRLLQKGSAPA